MKLNKIRPLFSTMSESEQAQFFEAYYNRRAIDLAEKPKPVSAKKESASPSGLPSKQKTKKAATSMTPEMLEMAKKLGLL